MDNSEETQIAIHRGQRTIWDELVEQQSEIPAGRKRWIAGMLSHLGLCSDDTLVRIGAYARREADAATRRKNAPLAAGHMAMLGACTDEWLRRHPRPTMGGDV